MSAFSWTNMDTAARPRGTYTSWSDLPKKEWPDWMFDSPAEAARYRGGGVTGAPVSPSLTGYASIQPATSGSPTGQTTGAPLTPGTNPYWTVSNVKSPKLADAIDTILGDYKTSRNAYADALKGFQTEQNASRAKAAGYLGEESGAIGDYYNGGVQAKLDKILADRTAATGAITNRLRAEALGADAERGLMGGTVGSGYRSRLLSDSLAKIYENEANLRTQQQLANLQWLEGQKQGLLGKRATAERSYLDSALDVPRARTWMDQATMNYLTGINQNEKANMFYGLLRNYDPSIDRIIDGMVPTRVGGGVGSDINPQLLAALASRQPMTSNYGQVQALTPQQRSIQQFQNQAWGSVPAPVTYSNPSFTQLPIDWRSYSPDTGATNYGVGGNIWTGPTVPVDPNYLAPVSPADTVYSDDWSYDWTTQMPTTMN